MSTINTFKLIHYTSVIYLCQNCTYNICLTCYYDFILFQPTVMNKTVQNYIFDLFPCYFTLCTLTKCGFDLYKPFRASVLIYIDEICIDIYIYV